MTLALLWEECCAETADLHSADHPVNPWRDFQFYENYRRFGKSLKRSMRQTQRAGKKLFIDFAGLTQTVLTDRSKMLLSAAAASYLKNG